MSIGISTLEFEAAGCRPRRAIRRAEKNNLQRDEKRRCLSCQRASSNHSADPLAPFSTTDCSQKSLHTLPAAIQNGLAELEGVTFWFKDYRRGGQRETMTVTGEEFVRLFTLHLLPPGLHRVRYSGIFAQSKRGRLLPICRQLLNVQQEEGNQEQRSQDEWLLDQDKWLLHQEERLPRCPTCGEPALVWTQELPGRRAPNAFDSSKPAPRMRRYRPTTAGPAMPRGP